MNYKIQLKLLRVLVYGKRALWWLGGRLGLVLGGFFNVVWRMVAYFDYKTKLILSRLGLGGEKGWLIRRGILQTLLVILFLVFSISQTKAGFKDLSQESQKTIAYKLLGSEEDFGTEEITAGSETVAPSVPSWREGAVAGNTYIGKETGNNISLGNAGVMVGGGAILKPVIINGAPGGNAFRAGVIEYTVEPGDSLGGIAVDFNVNVSTILWENGLTLRSILRPGNVLRILPINGIRHTVKKGDNIKKIAILYGAKQEEIIAYNHLKENGGDIRIGEKLIIPDGVKPREAVVARVKYTQPSGRSIATPPPSTAAPSVGGFIWPTAARVITQYFGLRHNGLDISGPWQTPIYAAKSGIVRIARCGWNGGYGCYVVIDHAGSLSTLYGHDSQLLVTPGEAVETGQTIALMGNTGNVRGFTGIHVHFEVRINDIRVNPLRYVR